MLSYASMTLRKKFFLPIILISLVTFSWSADVKTIQYRSLKNSSYNQQKVSSESHIYLSGEKVKIDYLQPEKRTLILNKDLYVIEYSDDNKKTISKYNLSDVPLTIRQLLIPSIFGAATFLQNIKIGYNLSTSGNIFLAVPKQPKNISKIEYSLNKEKNQVLYYKIYGMDGGLLTEARFFDYKVFNKIHLLPTRIQTIINGQDGLINDEETFSRIKVDQPVDNNEFKI